MEERCKHDNVLDDGPSDHTCEVTPFKNSIASQENTINLEVVTLDSKSFKHRIYIKNKDHKEKIYECN